MRSLVGNDHLVKHLSPEALSGAGGAPLLAGQIPR